MHETNDDKENPNILEFECRWLHVSNTIRGLKGTFRVARMMQRSKNAPPIATQGPSEIRHLMKTHVR